MEDLTVLNRSLTILMFPLQILLEKRDSLLIANDPNQHHLVKLVKHSNVNSYVDIILEKACRKDWEPVGISFGRLMPYSM